MEQGIALQIADNTASLPWIYKVKDGCNIVTRKITKFVGRCTTQNTAEYEAEIATLIAQICLNATNNPAS